jgi:hypothetical protein
MPRAADVPLRLALLSLLAVGLGCSSDPVSESGEGIELGRDSGDIALADLLPPLDAPADGEDGDAPDDLSPEDGADIADDTCPDCPDDADAARDGLDETGGEIGGDGGDACGDEEYVPFARLYPSLQSLNGQEVLIEGVLASGQPSCTERLCPVTEPCCNTCATRLGFVAERAFVPLEGLTAGAVGCTGDECSPLASCAPGWPGEPLRGRFLVNDPPGSRPPVLVLLEECPFPSPARRAQARLSWQAPGGIAGWGPALLVSGDGSLSLWEETFGFDPGEAPLLPPDALLALTPGAADELFARWQATDLSELPHEGGANAECYPLAWARLCDACDATKLEYDVPQQLAPEMERVWDWFDAVLVGRDARLRPRTFCAF